MNITVKQAGIQDVDADAIIVNLFEGVKEVGGASGVLDKALEGAISHLIAMGDLKGKSGETAVLYPRELIAAKRVIVVGLGKAEEFDLEAVREAAAVAIKQAKKLGAKTVASIVHGGGVGDLNIADAAQAVVEGSMLALYNYQWPYPKKQDNDEAEAEVEALTLVEFDQNKIAQIEAGAKIGEAVANGVYLTRTLTNHPANIATPTVIAETAEAMCKEVGLNCTILEETQIKEEAMNLLLAVTQGATEAGKFVIMEHKPDNAPSTGPVVLVGKGISFDTGGYNLKPGDWMLGMKGDMGGAAAVIGTMQVIGQLNLPLHVVGLVPTVENMISGTAYKPQDVFVAKNGVSVEITNTDAEGRLVLADALCYADTLNPSQVVDIATLTGGKLVALGRQTNAIFVNDDTLKEALLSASQKVSEPLWQLPLDKIYDRQLKSDVADVKNTGGRPASAITAARFLAHFIGKWPWAHLDIAGSEFYKPGPDVIVRSYLTKGASGIPVRTLVAYLQSLV